MPFTVHVDASPFTAIELVPPPPSYVIGAAIEPAVLSTLSAPFVGAVMLRLFTVGAGRVSVVPFTVTARSAPALVTPIVGGLAATAGATAHGAWNTIDDGAEVTGLPPPPDVVLDADTGTIP